MSATTRRKAPSREELIRSAYAHLERYNDLEAPDGELAVTEALAQAIAVDLQAEFELEFSPAWEKVQEWLVDEERWSPFIDEVALERALDFDWPVIDSLTRAERETFYDRLAAMNDPYSEEVEERALHARQRGETGGEALFQPSPRHERWAAGTKRQRDRITTAVWRRRGEVRAA